MAEYSTRQFHVWEVGDGTNIKAFTDNWIPCSTSPPPPVQSTRLPDISVSMFINNELLSWDISTLQQYFSLDQVYAISSIHLSTATQDTIRWSLTDSGDFTLKSTYRAILHSLSPPPTTIYTEKFWLSIWHLEVPYKCQLFISKLAHQILPVLHRLAQHLHLQHTSCYFCDSQVETATHILLQRPFAAAIWSHFVPDCSSTITSQHSVNVWLQGWSDSANTFNFRGRQRIHLIVVILWHIWKARCTLAFDHTAQSPQSFIHKIKEFCRLHCISSQVTSNVQTTTPAVQPTLAVPATLAVPTTNGFYLNVDASILPNSHSAGSAFVLTTPFASFVTASASPL